MAPLIDSFTLAGGSISDGGTFPSHGSNFPWSSGGFGTVYCGGGGQVEGAWGFKPSQCTWMHLPLFPLLVSSSRGKVVSATLGVPPPNLDTQEIGHSLAIDQDEESILSNSYSDRHSSTVDSSAIWGKHTTCTVRIKNRNPAPLSIETKMDIGLRSGDKDRDKNRDREL